MPTMILRGQKDKRLRAGHGQRQCSPRVRDDPQALTLFEMASPDGRQNQGQQPARSDHRGMHNSFSGFTGITPDT